MTGPVAGALAALRRDPGAASWCRLPFFAVDGEADRIASALDGALAGGAALVPPPSEVFAALRLTPLESVKAVILGQDPYPKRGDAHGLAFSYVGPRAPAGIPADHPGGTTRRPWDRGSPIPET